MKDGNKCILTQAERIALFISFYSEALMFLGVPKEKWAMVNGMNSGSNGKRCVIDYANSKILVNVSFLRTIIQRSSGCDCCIKSIHHGNSKVVTLTYYDLAADAFTSRKGREYMIDTIGKQPFMRSGNQSGFLIGLSAEHDFNMLPEVRYVFFSHDKSVTNRIFEESKNGDKYMPQEMLRSHWYKRMSDEKAVKEISVEALNLNFDNNRDISRSKIRKELQQKGFHISSKKKTLFTDEELNSYYMNALDFWKDFCSNVCIYSPEGELLRKHLLNLPNDPRYRWAFFL